MISLFLGRLDGIIHKQQIVFKDDEKLGNPGLEVVETFGRPLSFYNYESLKQSYIKNEERRFSSAFQEKKPSQKFSCCEAIVDLSQNSLYFITELGSFKGIRLNQNACIPF